MSQCSDESVVHASPFSQASFWVVVGIASVLSILVTGYRFGVSNQLFHLVITGNLYDDPQYVSDSFIQSVRYFAAGPWLLLRGSEAWADPYWLFLGLLFLSRVLSFAGFLACAHLLGVRGLHQQALFALLLTTTVLMQGFSLAGGNGLFIDHFTHSELANGLFLLVTYFGIRANVALTMALVGATFFVNAFIGVWTGFVAAAVLLNALFRRDLCLRRALAPAVIGGLVAAALAAPVIVNIVQNPDFGVRPDFDYLEFIKYYYPFHFLFSEIGVLSRGGIALLSLTGFGVFYLGWRRDNRFVVALAACIGIYGIGIVVPVLTDSAMVLNLHLLRSGGLIHELTALGCCALATRLYFDEDRFKRRVVGPLLAIVVATPARDRLLENAVFALIGASIGGLLVWELLGFRRFVTSSIIERAKLIRTVAVVWLALASPYAIFESYRAGQEPDSWIGEWRTIGEWAARSTPVTSVFMVPFHSFSGNRPATTAETGDDYSGTFEYLSRRRVWVDFKRGAAIMWHPSYYATWKPRVVEGLVLKTTADRLAYAQAHGVDYVIEISPSGCHQAAVFHTQRLCVLAVG